MSTRPARALLGSVAKLRNGSAWQTQGLVDALHGERRPPEEKSKRDAALDQLVAMGFGEAVALAALTACHDDVNGAMEQLLTH
eukprot:SAG11_NODE_325_length_10712_cov_15.479883_4_plen_83_part_00